MDLSNVVIKNFEREDVKNMRTFAEVMNSRDNFEITIPDPMIEFILSNEEFRKSILIACHEDKMIGFASCMKNVSKPEAANFELIIHPDYRRQGLGSLLYNRLLEYGKENSVKDVTAFAKERMPQSVDFLEKRGFKPNKYSWKMDLNLSDIDYRKIPADKFDIRVIGIGDIKKYIDIMNAGFKKEGDELFTEKSFEMTFKNSDAYVFFIEQEGKEIATAAINLEKDISRGYIYNVTVYSEFRGKGFGEIVINHCINIVKEANLGKASLNVYGDNKNALNLYKKLGFVERETDITFKGEI